MGKCACYSSKLFCQSPFYSLVCIFKKGERKLNIFLVLRIKRLSVYPEMHCIVVGAWVHCLSARGMKEWWDIWGKQLLWLRFSDVVEGVKPLEQPQYTLDTNLWQLFPERTCWWLLGRIVPTRLVSILNWRDVRLKNLTYYCKKFVSVIRNYYMQGSTISDKQIFQKMWI